MNRTDTKNFLHQILTLNLDIHLQNMRWKPEFTTSERTFYRSPFQDRSKAYPMLWVDKGSQLWKCEFSQLSGNIIDLQAALQKSGTVQAIETLFQSYPDLHGAARHPATSYPGRYWNLDPIHESPVCSRPFIDFLSDHGISRTIMDNYCREFQCLTSDNRGLISGIGISSKQKVNQLLIIPEGYRSLGAMPHMGMEVVGSCGHSFFHHGSDTVDVFSNVIDLLSYVQFFDKEGGSLNNLLLLSEEFAFEHARPLMENHKEVNLYLPKTPSASLYCDYANWLNKNIYKDHRHTYLQSASLGEAFRDFKWALPSLRTKQKIRKRNRL